MTANRISPDPDISCQNLGYNRKFLEYGDHGMNDLIKDYQRNSCGVVDLTGDEDPTDEDGDIGVSVSLGVEIFLEGKKYQESNIGDSDNTGDGGKQLVEQ
ncbi:hypothetical protein Tco_1113698 [Tanacetum coccineum]|uniref:Uncharacterized protein n=1 Tax=Tanacetum coccineum TaxID=301880 RepID=A0ABQ5ISZ0_9ASTR